VTSLDSGEKPQLAAGRGVCGIYRRIGHKYLFDRTSIEFDPIFVSVATFQVEPIESLKESDLGQD
jgi:hypothetical protein